MSVNDVKAKDAVKALYRFCFDVFGTRIESRYDNPDEAIEMMQFMMCALRSGLADEIKALFYDTKCGMCCVRVSDYARGYGQMLADIYNIGDVALSSFIIEGEEDHPVRGKCENEQRFAHVSLMLKATPYN